MKTAGFRCKATERTPVMCRALLAGGVAVFPLLAAAAPVDLIVQLEGAPLAVKKGARGPQAFDPASAPALGAWLGTRQVDRAQILPGTETARKAAGRGTMLVRLVLETDEDAAEVLVAVRGLPGIRHAELNQRGRLNAAPSDPLYTQQAGDLAPIGIEDAWAIQAGSDPAVRVAVIDSGIETVHEDLENVIDLSASYNVEGEGAELFDDVGHGTRIAGIIAAEANNSVGIAGVGYGATILAYDVYGAGSSVMLSDVLAAMNLALADGTDIINLSLAFDGYSKLLEETCTAAEAAGVLVVASAGNDNQGDFPAYPASFASVMGVGAVDDAGTARAIFSNYNGLERTIADLFAPGNTIFSTIPGSQYNGIFGSGTSFSAPVVCGVAALLKAKYPEQSGAAIRQHLLATASPIPGFVPVNGQGAGLVSAGAALATAMVPSLRIDKIVVNDSIALNAANDGDGVLDGGETVQIVVYLQNDAADAFGLDAVLSTESMLFETLGTVSVPLGDALSGKGANNAGAPFGLVEVGAVTAAQQVPFTLTINDTNGPVATIPFSLAVEDEVDVSGVVASPRIYTSNETYRVTGNLLWRSTITVEPGTTFKVDPGVEIRVSNGANVTAEGTAEAPIVFTSAVPAPDTDAAPPFVGVGPRTEMIDETGFPVVIYVSESTGNDFTGDGSLIKPYKSLTGISGNPQVKGGPQPYIIKVAIGTYGPVDTRFQQVGRDSMMIGGYSPDFVERDIFRYPTVLDGRQLGPAIVLNGVNTRLDGFIVTNGKSSGVSFPASDVSGIVSNCVVIGNSAPLGGGIFVQGDAVIRNCVIAENTSSGIGGGIHWAANGRGTVGGCIFIRNRFEAAAGIAIDGRCTVQGNLLLEAGSVAILLRNGSRPVITGNVFDRAVTAIGTQSGVPASPVNVSNNSIVDGERAIATQFPVTATNNIMWNLSGPPVETVPESFFLNNLVQGNPALPNSSGNFEADPEFVGIDRFGIVESAEYRASIRMTALRLGASPNDDPLEAGTIILVDDRQFAVLATIDEETLVAGDATLGGTISYPNSYRVFSHRLTANSPAIGAGLGPGAFSGVPATDIDGETRSGATTDIGADLYSPETGGADYRWGLFRIEASAASASFEHVRIDNANSVRTELAAAQFDTCTFANNATAGLQATVPLTNPVANSQALDNRGPGLDLPGSTVSFGTAEGNFGTGIAAGTVLNSIATLNDGDGIVASNATASGASSNTGAGIRVSALATNLTAENNRQGLVVTGGSLTNATSTFNWAEGINLSGGGTVSGLLSSRNGGNGMISGAASIEDSTFSGNGRLGVLSTGGTTLENVAISGNAQGAAQGVNAILDSSVTGNGNGLANVSTVNGSYIGFNQGAGLSGTTVADSSIVGNTGIGATVSGSIENSWVVRNSGIGIDGASGSGTVDRVTISGNNGGTRNVASVANSNFLGNGSVEALDDVADGGTTDRLLEGNYWGPANIAIIAAEPEFANLPFLTDLLDGSGDHLIDIWPAATAPIANAPDGDAPAFVLSVLPNIEEPLNVSVTPFIVTFSSDMDTGTTPSITFDTEAPYTFHVVEPVPGWIDNRTFQGTFAIQSDTGDGLNRIRISNARDAGGFLLPPDDSNAFFIDTNPPGTANNGIATGTGSNIIQLTWDRFNESKLPGKATASRGPKAIAYTYNIRRSRSTIGPYTRINPEVIQEATPNFYVDFGLLPGTTYYYIVDGIDPEGNAIEWAYMEGTTRGEAVPEDEFWELF